MSRGALRGLSALRTASRQLGLARPQFRQPAFPRPQPQKHFSTSPRPQVQQAIQRRNYASTVVTLNRPPPPNKGGYRWLLYVWRATYITAMGGAGYFAWTIYQLRHPAQQVEPDSSKKILVVLGTLNLIWQYAN